MWNATAASPHNPPATIVIASNRCRSFGMRRLSHAKKRANRPFNPGPIIFNAGETSSRRTSHFKYRSSESQRFGMRNSAERHPSLNRVLRLRQFAS